jgi:hypothetical protein
MKIDCDRRHESQTDCPQSLWVLLDCVVGVVTIGRKVFAPDERTLSLDDDL